MTGYAIKRMVILAGVLVMGALLTTGCGGAEEPLTPAQLARREAREIFKVRCSVCHGLEGKGDGPGAVALDPKPRNFKDPAWGPSVTDEHIDKIIVEGGPAVGLSIGMAPNPDLASKPEVVAELRKHVRSLAK